MTDNSRIIFIHGSESSSQTYKAGILRGLFPGMLTPDFTDDVEERLAQLRTIIGDTTGWTLIGSSLGGLAAAIFAAQSPAQVRKLVLLAPALALPEFDSYQEGQIAIPTVVIHGTQDNVVPLDTVRRICERVFPQLTYHVVDDDHRMHKTAETLDWNIILA